MKTQTTIVTATAAAQLAILAGANLDAKHGFTFRGAPMDRTAMHWFLIGAYGIELPADSQLECAQVLLAGRVFWHARALENKRREITRLLPYIDKTEKVTFGMFDNYATAVKDVENIFEDRLKNP